MAILRLQTSIDKFIKLQLLILRMNNVNLLNRTKDVLDELAQCLESDLNESRNAMAIRALESDITSPCVLAVAGKVKAGKSFLINALLGVDLAMTGVTETTATINIFKKGKPIYPDRPVLCEWTDGTKEWVPREFLNALVGTGEETLKKTAKIEKLTFYIDDNPLLEDVTLVDTPGIGADVGDDGEAHEIQTEAYFKLRKRHQSDTVKLSNSADAVLYLFNTVPTETDKTFLQQLYNNGHGLTALNGIGVLSKVDKNVKQIDNIPKFASEFEKELFTIVPTSAAVERFLPAKEQATALRDKLRNGFNDGKYFKLAMGSESAFLHPKLPGCNIGVDERKGLLRAFGANDLPWSTFALIATQLYESEDIDSALGNLRKIGGIENLRQLVERHFFTRSRMLRANTVLTEMGNILSSILYSSTFIHQEEASENREACLSACKQLPEPQASILSSLVNQYVPSQEKIGSIKAKFRKIKGELESIREELDDANNCYLTYQKVVATPEDFSDDERQELNLLLSWHQMDSDLRQRQKYWSAVAAMSAPHSVRQTVALVAKKRYNKLITIEHE